MNTKTDAMLVPYDGSANAKRALDYAIGLARRTGEEIHILNVQTSLPGAVSDVVGRGNVKQYHYEEGEKVLAPAVRKLKDAGIAFHKHIGVGQPGPVASEFADQLKCTHVVMGTRGHGSALGLLLGSVATYVIGHVKVPVTLIK